MDEIKAPHGTIGHDTGLDLDETPEVSIGQLVSIAAEMILAIPDDEIGSAVNVAFSNGLAELVRRAAGIPEEYGYIVDDAIAWRNA